MRKSLTQRTLEGAAWIGGASVARLALRVVSVAILARLLTPHEYGVVAGALIAMDFASMIYGMGLAPTLVQRKVVRPDHVATAFFCALFMAFLAAAGMWYAAPAVADLLQIPELTQILKVLAWLTPFGAFSVLCEALLARNMQVKSVAMRPLFSFTISNFLVAIPLAWYGFGYWSLVAMQGVDIVVSAAMLGFAARKLLVWPRFSRRAFGELWRLSLGFSVNQPFIYLVAERRQVHHRPRARHGDTRHLHAGLVFHKHGDDAVRKYRPPLRLSRDGQGSARRGEASKRAPEIVLSSRALDATGQCLLRHLRPRACRSSARAQMALGRRALRDPVRDACTSLSPGANCATLFQALGHPYWITRLTFAERRRSLPESGG